MFERCSPKKPSSIGCCLGAVAYCANYFFLLVTAQFGGSFNFHAAIPRGARQARVRSRTIDLSNSANLPSICMTMRPADVVVSTASVMLELGGGGGQGRR